MNTFREECFPPASATVSLQDQRTARVAYIAHWQPIEMTRVRLDVKAEGLSQLHAIVSDNLDVNIARIGSRGTVIVQPKKEGPATLRLTYSFELKSLTYYHPELRIISRSCLPYNSAASADCRGRIPWRKPPDLIIKVLGIPPNAVALGPRYRVGNDVGSPDFGFYEHNPHGWIVLGEFPVTCIGPRLNVLSPSPPWDSVDDLREFLRDETTRIVAFLEREYGMSAVAVDSIALVRSKQERSFSLGSSIVVNVERFGKSHADPSVQHDAANLLAHELAHSWWTYSALWANPQFSRTVNEMLATVVELLAAEEMGGPDRLKVAAKWGLWNKLAGALKASEADLRGRAVAFSGVWAGSLLYGLIQSRRSSSVRQALRQLWNASQEKVLDREVLAAILKSCLGATPCLATLEAIDCPKPLVASLRMEGPLRDGSWRLLIGIVRRRGELLNRLKSIRFVDLKIHEELDKVVMTLTSLRDVQVTAVELQPACMVSRREAKALFLTSGSLRSRLWRWARDVLTRKKPKRWRAMLAGFTCLSLNSDDPLGYWGIAQGQFPAIIQRALLNAARARCIYYKDQDYSERTTGSQRPPFAPTRH